MLHLSDAVTKVEELLFAEGSADGCVAQRERERERKEG
jgi:hypothetical protein